MSQDFETVSLGVVMMVRRLILRWILKNKAF